MLTCKLLEAAYKIHYHLFWVNIASTGKLIKKGFILTRTPPFLFILIIITFIG
jgi:hypothetical protein